MGLSVSQSNTQKQREETLALKKENGGIERRNEIQNKYSPKHNQVLSENHPFINQSKQKYIDKANKQSQNFDQIDKNVSPKIKVTSPKQKLVGYKNKISPSHNETIIKNVRQKSDYFQNFDWRISNQSQLNKNPSINKLQPQASFAQINKLGKDQLLCDKQLIRSKSVWKNRRQLMNEIANDRLQTADNGWDLVNCVPNCTHKQFDISKKICK